MESNVDLVPSCAFQLLAIAMALAAFLPALVYSYSRSLLEELARKGDGGKDLRKKVIPFVLAMDFILTQSVFLVIYSGTSGVIIFLAVTHEWHPGEYGTALLAAWLVYCFLTLIVSNIGISKTNKKLVFDLNWLEWKKYRLGWLVLVLAYLCLSFYLSYRSIVDWPCENAARWFIYLIGISTWLLIIAATIWIVPLSQYKPLQNIMSPFLDRDKTTGSGSEV
jgi:hypothetical protein